MSRPLSVGVAGLGTVGAGVLKVLRDNAGLIAARAGRPIAVTAVSSRDRHKDRGVPVAGLRWYEDPVALVADPGVDVIVESIGGSEGPARALVEAALAAGKHVVTANKALLALHGRALAQLAEAHQVPLAFEAAVAGGIPAIKAVREGLAGNDIRRVAGILNGTCNYILTEMRLRGLQFAEVVAEAQKLGYAEANPTLDVDGHDAAHKTGILASLAHGFWVDHHDIHVEGIRSLTPLDIRFAQQLGYTIKLLGSVRLAPPAKAAKGKKAAGGARISVAVSPTLVPQSHVLASVNDVFNAVFVSGFPIGDTLYYGRGAGKDATASAVLSDLADAGLDIVHGTLDRVPSFVPCAKGTVVPYSETSSRYYLRLTVLDKPGVIAKVSSILSKAGISLASIVQPEGHEGEAVPLILMTHVASRAAMDKACAAIAKLPETKGPALLLPVEDFA